MIRRASLHALSLALAVAVGLAGTAEGHTRSQSFSSWRILDGEVRLTFSVAAVEATRLAALDPDALDLGTLLAAHIERRLSVRTAGGACSPLGRPRPLRAAEGYVRAEWGFGCASDVPIEVVNGAFFDVAPSHIHYARFRTGEAPPIEYLFTDAERLRRIGPLPVPRSSGEGASFSEYLVLGVDHILAGFDHLAFLLALLLLCRRLREVVFMVTGFTAGHSLTLSLAALGILEPNVPVIEAMIGFTIAIVAAENIAVTADASRSVAWAGGGLLGALALVSASGDAALAPLTVAGLALFAACYLPLSRSRETATRLRPTLTVLFGLIHGCGFAAVLLEIGIPTDRLVQALVGFNVGVEIGQLCVVGALGLIAVAARPFVRPAASRLALDALSAGLCALGLFWFVQRGYLG